MESKNGPTTVEEYISQFPDEVQQILGRIRALIRELAPQADERIAYQMPGYYLNGPLVYFAGFKHHIGIYPTGVELQPLEAELSSYKRSKGTVQFPLDKPIPYDLITKIVRYRVAENLKKGKSGREKLDTAAS